MRSVFRAGQATHVHCRWQCRTGLARGLRDQFHRPFHAVDASEDLEGQ